MQLTAEEVKYLEDIAYQIRRLSVEMITYARWGHIGGSLSMADLLAVLYFHTMQVDPPNRAGKAETALFCPRHMARLGCMQP